MDTKPPRPDRVEQLARGLLALALLAAVGWVLASGNGMPAELIGRLAD